MNQQKGANTSRQTNQKCQNNPSIPVYIVQINWTQPWVDWNMSTDIKYSSHHSDTFILNLCDKISIFVVFKSIKCCSTKYSNISMYWLFCYHYVFSHNANVLFRSHLQNWELVENSVDTIFEMLSMSNSCQTKWNKTWKKHIHSLPNWKSMAAHLKWNLI